MKESYLKKKNSFLKKFFIKVCRLFNFEIIDQASFYLPLENKTAEESLSVLGKKSITIPMGKIEIKRPVNNLDIIFRSCSSVNMLTQNKKRLFEKEKSEYTLRSLNSIVKSLNYSKEEFKNIKIQYKERDKLMPIRGTLSIEKAKKFLNFKPKYSIDIGYIKYINWYKNFWNELEV